MATMKGKDAHLRRLRNLLSAAEQAANRTVVVGADMIKAEAQRSITAGAVSGKHHVPSRPGEPPNEDSNHLRTNIEKTNPEPGLAEVRSEAEYATALEFGTSKMAARPYMRPARDKSIPAIERLFAKEMNKAVKLSKG